jgi:hypothetical protein
MSDAKKETSPAFIHSDLDDYGLSPFELRVYLRVVRRADAKLLKGICRESVANMARGCGMSVRSAYNALRVLVGVGLLGEQTRPKGRPVEYVLLPRQYWKSPEELERIRAELKPDSGKTSARGADP